MPLTALLLHVSSQFCRVCVTAVTAVLVLVASATQAETRTVFNSESPSWLRAVGKLQVPGVKYDNGHQRIHQEGCSATLIAKPGNLRADTIVTAWHCLEYYGDLSKAIRFTLLHGTKQSVSIEARRLADGGSMSADWAVLRLLEAVPSDRITALTVHLKGADKQRSITMAGYSKNSPEERLSYDLNCSIITPAPSGHRDIASNCSALQGASGGAVVQFSGGMPMLTGVISQGNGEGLSVYVPVEKFRSAIRAALR